MAWQRHAIKTIENCLEKYEHKIQHEKIADWKHRITTSDRNMGRWLRAKRQAHATQIGDARTRAEALDKIRDHWDS